METSLAFQEHPDDHIWERYAFGHLSPAETNAIEDHLILCERCQQTLAKSDQYVRAMKFATAEFEKRKAARSAKILTFTGPRIRKIASAGTVAAACLAAVLWIAPGGVLHFARGHFEHGSAPPVTVALQSLRGGTDRTMNRAPASHPLDLSISLAGLPASAEYRLEVVTLWGATIWSGAAETKNGNLTAHLTRSLGKGAYWVRLYTSSSELVEEFSLTLD